MKHQPATPLPWRVSPIAPREVQQQSAIWSICQCGIDGDKNSAYIAHAANAYPRLVEALRSIAKPALGGKQQQYMAQAILRELGEE